MRRKGPGSGVPAAHDAQPRLKRSVPRPLASRSSLKASRLLNTAAATLAGSVLTDSTAEHYRAGFHNRAMFVAPAVSAMALTSALSALTPHSRRSLPRRAVFAMSVLTGLVGFGFHLANVSRRVGGWRPENAFHGAPVAAPLAITMAGLLGIAADRVARSHQSDPSAESESLANCRASVALGRLAALGLVGTSMEAGALHFRGAFQNPFMYAPVALPPVAAVTLATAVLGPPSTALGVARTLLRLTAWLGVVGTGFHAWGVQRRMGGWGNWRQNLMAGPPLPAPPAFTGLALAGLAALELLDTERDDSISDSVR
jgi:hypothetical protein